MRGAAAKGVQNSVIAIKRWISAVITGKIASGMDFAKSNFVEGVEGVEVFDGALWAQDLIGETVPQIVERG